MTRGFSTAALVAFSQIAWVASVVGAAHGNGWLGPVVVLSTVLFAAVLSGQVRETLLLAAAAGAIGLVLESLMIASGRVQYATPGPFPLLPPAWIIGLWVVFSVLPNTALSWLHGRRRLQALLGFAGAPLAYLGGAKLGAMTFVEPLGPGLVLLAVLWALALPLLMHVAERIPPKITTKPAI